MSSEMEYNLKMNESVKIFKRFASTYWVTYAGMLNESVCSIVISYRSGGNFASAYNLYIPKKYKHTIPMKKGWLDVQSVTPEYIIFRYIKP
jgi:hypothetical protein